MYNRLSQTQPFVHENTVPLAFRMTLEMIQKCAYVHRGVKLLMTIDRCDNAIQNYPIERNHSHN